MKWQLFDHLEQLRQKLSQVLLQLTPERDRIGYRMELHFRCFICSKHLSISYNILESQHLSPDDLLTAYREQQAPERGFAFLKDPLFFADSVFLKTAERIETMAMVMGLCLLVYKLGQRQLRLQLKQGQTGIKNQLGKLTECPTLSCIFQCFQGIHFVVINGVKQIFNLTKLFSRESPRFFCVLCTLHFEVRNVG